MPTVRLSPQTGRFGSRRRVQERWRLVRIGLVAAGSLLVLAACSSSADETAEQVNAQTRRIDEQVGSEFDLTAEPTDEQARCLDEAGFDDQLLVDGLASQVDAEPMLRVFLRCIPELDQYDPFIAGVVGAFELSIGNGLDLAPEEGRCFVAELLGASDPARALVNPDEDDVEIYRAAAQGCFDEDNLAVLARQEGFTSYGDDPGLDELYDGCQEGADIACDLLFLESAVDSEYEMLAVTCGGRTPPAAGPCSVELASVDADGLIDAASPGADRLVERCEGGDQLACDLLGAVAPVGSAIEQIGITCGGELRIPAVPDCRTVVDG